MSTSAATLDGFPLIGLTPQGGRARLLDLDGWFTSKLRRFRADLTGRHGGTSSAGLRAAKQIVASGMIVYPDALSAATERRTLEALGGYGAFPLVVTDALGTLTIDVSVDMADIKVRQERILNYSFEVTADSPFAVSTMSHTTAVASGATVTAPNAGTAPADMWVTLTTGGTVILSAGGLTLTTGALPAGAVIDTGATSVKDSTGADLFTLVSLPPLWPAIPAAGGPVGQLGTANLSVVHFDTYA